MALRLQDTPTQTSISLSVVLQLRQQHTAGQRLRGPRARRRNRRSTPARVQLLRDRCDLFSEGRWPTLGGACCRPPAALFFQPLHLLLLPVVLPRDPLPVLSAWHRAPPRCGPCPRAAAMRPVPRGGTADDGCGMRVEFSSQCNDSDYQQGRKAHLRTLQRGRMRR